MASHFRNGTWPILNISYNNCYGVIVTMYMHDVYKDYFKKKKKNTTLLQIKIYILQPLPLKATVMMTSLPFFTSSDSN